MADVSEVREFLRQRRALFAVSNSGKMCGVVTGLYTVAMYSVAIVAQSVRTRKMLPLPRAFFALPLPQDRAIGANGVIQRIEFSTDDTHILLHLRDRTIVSVTVASSTA
jgi:hypothetical protein